MLGPLDLLIIQGSPFCNINCKYCYLPDRGSTKKISLETIEALFRRLIEARLIAKEFTIVWHAGEPLAVPIPYYTAIIDVINKVVPKNVKVFHSFQTNGTLINEEWCLFFKEIDARMGLSIDGPDFIHDRYRVKRNGKGSFTDAMRGVELLRKHEIDFHVISVISDYSLDFPDEIFNFFLDLNVQRLGFNIEEVEGINNTSSISDKSNPRVQKFLKRVFELQKKCAGKIILREFESAFRKIIGDPTRSDNSVYKTIPQSHLLSTYGIISVDSEGNFMTFSPELLGQKSAEYNDFILGNVHDNSFIDVLQSERYKQMLGDIKAGIDLCNTSCEYFKVCGGGAPSNKYYENGTFRSTETLYCKYSIQIPIDLVLEDVEKSLSINPSFPGFLQGLTKVDSL